MNERWNVHSDLSGRCWIEPHPPEVPKGFYEDVPRRIYLWTPWFRVIVGARTQGWLPVLGYLPFRPRWAGWLCWWFVVVTPRTARRRPGKLMQWRPGWYR